MVWIWLQSNIKEMNVRCFDHNKVNYHLTTDTDSVSLWSVLLQGKYIGVKNIRD